MTWNLNKPRPDIPSFVFPFWFKWGGSFMEREREREREREGSDTDFDVESLGIQY